MSPANCLQLFKSIFNAKWNIHRYDTKNNIYIYIHTKPQNIQIDALIIIYFSCSNLYSWCWHCTIPKFNSISTQKTKKKPDAVTPYQYGKFIQMNKSICHATQYFTSMESFGFAFGYHRNIWSKNTSGKLWYIIVYCLFEATILLVLMLMLLINTNNYGYWYFHTINILLISRIFAIKSQ